MPETAWQEAKRKMKTAGIGATYQHPHGSSVVVTRFHEPTGRVWWQRASGPGPADSHRSRDCDDFLSVYTLQRGA